MSRNNGQSIVLGNGSAVVDDFELISRKAIELRPRKERTQLDDLSDTIRFARCNLTALESIRMTCGGEQSDADSAIDYLSRCVNDRALRSIRQIAAERVS